VSATRFDQLPQNTRNALERVRSKVVGKDQPIQHAFAASVAYRILIRIYGIPDQVPGLPSNLEELHLAVLRPACRFVDNSDHAILATAVKYDLPGRQNGLTTYQIIWYIATGQLIPAERADTAVRSKCTQAHQQMTSVLQRVRHAFEGPVASNRSRQPRVFGRRVTRRRGSVH
jgi:hypothetical protein